jgi:MFS family permease
MVTLGLSGDGRVLFATRIARMFAYGSLAVILVLYLATLGFDGVRIGLLLTLTLVGDALISLWLTTNADRFGRRRVLTAGGGLMLLAGLLFAVTSDFRLLLLAATIGVISPSGNEVGPFLAVEQAALTQTIPDRRRTNIFAWYNLAGWIATAFGSLTAGVLVSGLQVGGLPPVEAYRVIVVGYALVGAALAVTFARLSPSIEAQHESNGTDRDDRPPSRFGLHRSRRIVFRLAALFSLDAFGGGLVPQSLIAYWFHVKFGVEPAVLGAIFFAANLVAAASALLAARLAARIGLLNTMVFTHLPSNVLLILVPFMPTLPIAVAVLLLRYSISQMDVPTRQSYTMAVVEPDERSAAAGITGVARTTGAAVAPVVSAPLLADPALWALPFVLAGSVKIVYDVLLYRAFRAIKPPEEGSPGASPASRAATR